MSLPAVKAYTIAAPNTLACLECGAPTKPQDRRAPLCGQPSRAAWGSRGFRFAGFRGRSRSWHESVEGRGVEGLGTSQVDGFWVRKWTA